MPDTSIHEKQVSAFDTHEPDWVNIDLEPRNVDPKPRHTKATVIDQVPVWTSIDLEANAPPKKHFWRNSKKTKIVVGIAVAAMVLAGIFVPMGIAIKNHEDEGIH